MFSSSKWTLLVPLDLIYDFCLQQHPMAETLSFIHIVCENVLSFVWLKTTAILLYIFYVLRLLRQSLCIPLRQNPVTFHN